VLGRKKEEGLLEKSKDSLAAFIKDKVKCLWSAILASRTKKKGGEEKK